MKIKLSMNAASINTAIQKLTEYQESLQIKCQEIADRLAQYGLALAEAGFGGAAYDGTKDVSVTVEQTEHGYAIVASGATVAFIEFGTGVYYPDNHPLAAEFGAIRGGYGKGHGKQQTWGYYGDDPGTNGIVIHTSRGDVILTHGNPGSLTMYNAAKDMRAEIERVAREVFAT